MTLTIFGLAVAAIGLVMFILSRPLRDFYAVLLVSAVFGSAEAISLPMLGGASLTVPFLFVLFVIARVFFLGRKTPALLQEAISANIWLVLFAIYGVAGAMILPRMFEGTMDVVSMRPGATLTPLSFSSQNITQATYICLTSMTAIAGYATARLQKSDTALFNGWTIAAFAFLLFGVIDLLGYYAGAGDLMNWARTAKYAIVSQSEMGIRRISGSFTEPSSFATFGAAPLILFSAFWLLNIRSKLCGALAAGLAIVMALSTSSTAFAMLAVLILMLLAGVAFAPMPGKVRQIKFISLGSIVVFAILAGAVLAALLPQFVSAFMDVAEKMTIGKASSSSATERGQWAAQGPAALAVSRGLGVGPGTFRSSGLIQAVIGSLGIFGIICLGMHMIMLARILMRKVSNSDQRITIAVTLTSLLMLTPQIASAASPDTGILFGAMSGFALGRHRKSVLESRVSAAQDYAVRGSPLNAGHGAVARI